MVVLADTMCHERDILFLPARPFRVPVVTPAEGAPEAVLSPILPSGLILPPQYTRGLDTRSLAQHMGLFGTKRGNAPSPATPLLVGSRATSENGFT